MRSPFSRSLCASSAWLALAACSSGGSAAPGGACTGDAATCVSGTLATRGFNGAYASAKVQLFAVFPYGKATPVAETTVTADGRFAFSGVDPGGRYYVQGIARFTTAGAANAVATVVGPLTLPLARGVDLKVRPVFLEALQQRPAGGALALSWVSAHVYDPGSGAELTDAKVSFHDGAQALEMPFATNLSGQKSYFRRIAKGDAPTALTIDVAHRAIPGGATFALAPETPDFDPAVAQPVEQASVAAGQPLDVTWIANPKAAYTIVELFAAGAGGTLTAQYASDAPRSPSVTKESIPASALASPGAYLLNVQMARPSCPVTADGCVYNASTAAVNFVAN